jgi:hypothetical protein
MHAEPENTDDPKGPVSRRDFLKQATLAALAAPLADPNILTPDVPPVLAPTAALSSNGDDTYTQKMRSVYGNALGMLLAIDPAFNSDKPLTPAEANRLRRREFSEDDTWADAMFGPWEPDESEKQAANHNAL